MITEQNREREIEGETGAGEQIELLSLTVAVQLQDDAALTRLKLRITGIYRSEAESRSRPHRGAFIEMAARWREELRRVMGGTSSDGAPRVRGRAVGDLALADGDLCDVGAQGDQVREGIHRGKNEVRKWRPARNKYGRERRRGVVGCWKR